MSGFLDEGICMAVKDVASFFHQTQEMVTADLGLSKGHLKGWHIIRCETKKRRAAVLRHSVLRAKMVHWAKACLCSHSVRDIAVFAPLVKVVMDSKRNGAFLLLQSHGRSILGLYARQNKHKQTVLIFWVLPFWTKFAFVLANGGVVNCNAMGWVIPLNTFIVLL